MHPSGHRCSPSVRPRAIVFSGSLVVRPPDRTLASQRSETCEYSPSILSPSAVDPWLVFVAIRCSYPPVLWCRTTLSTSARISEVSFPLLGELRECAQTPIKREQNLQGNVWIPGSPRKLFVSFETQESGRNLRLLLDQMKLGP